MTEKQKLFADEYLIDLNATRAYRAAYPSVKKDETAAAAAARMLRNVKVAEYVSERMQERQQHPRWHSASIIIRRLWENSKRK